MKLETTKGSAKRQESEIGAVKIDKSILERLRNAKSQIILVWGVLVTCLYLFTKIVRLRIATALGITRNCDLRLPIGRNARPRYAPNRINEMAASGGDATKI